MLITVLEYSLLWLIAPGLHLAEKVEPFVKYFAIVGAFPFLCAILMRRMRLREDWVLARFRAERIRHWKFQQLLDGPYIENLAADPKQMDREFSSRWGGLIGELDLGGGAMDPFVKSKPFASRFVHHQADQQNYRNLETLRGAAEVFERLRLNLQMSWFNQESERCQESDHHSERLASNLLFCSMVAAFADFVLVVSPWHLPPSWYPHGVEIVLRAVGIGAALLSAGVRVYRSASGISENAERYQRMASQLLWCSNHYSQIMDQPQNLLLNQQQLIGIMIDVERLCHGELTEFIRISRKSDYLF